MYLNTKLLHHFHFPHGLLNGRSVLRDFMSYNTTTVLVLFKDMDVLISHSSEECRTTEGSWTSTDKCNRFFIRRWENFRQRWVPDLWNTHLFEDPNGEFLKSVDLNCSLLGFTHIAVSSTELTDGTQLPAS